MTGGVRESEDRTRVMLTVTGARDVAVISGVVHARSVIFLCRSVIDGDAFARYPALVIDLRNLGMLSPEAQHELDVARQACLSRHQWLGVIRSGESARAAIVRARRWLRLLDGHTGQTRLRLYTSAAALRGLIDLMSAAWVAVGFRDRRRQGLTSSRTTRSA